MTAHYFMAALDLRDRACVVFGSAEEALARARTLREHGAIVRVVTPNPSPELSSWAQADPDVSLQERAPQPHDLEGAWLALVADQNPAWVELLGPAAREKRVFLCAIDQPAHNSFAHVGIARAGALQIGVSTSGVVPGIAGALRRALQDLLDESQFEHVVQRVTLLRESAPTSQRSSLVRTLASKIRLKGRLFLDEE